MSANISQPYELVQYSLMHESFPDELIIEEPLGWKDDLKNIKRDDGNFTTVTKYSMNLEFFGDAADIITELYGSYGFETEIILRKRIQHPTEQKVIVRYVAFLDGYTYNKKDDKIKLNTLESDLTANIKGYGKEKVEIIREESINGIDIGKLNVSKANIIGKDLLLVSKFAVRDGDQTLERLHAVNDIYYYTCLPMDNYAESHLNAADVTDYTLQTIQGGFPVNGETQQMFWNISDEDYVLNKMKISLDLKYEDNGLNQMSSCFFSLYLITFEDVSETGGSTQYKFKRRVKLADFNAPEGQSNTDPNLSSKVLKYENEWIDYQIYKGESLCLAVYEASNLANDLLLTCNDIDVQLVSNSFEEGTQCDMILPFELFERLIKIMSGRTDNVLVSDYFGRTELGYDKDGDGAFVGVTSGFLARGFKDKPLSTSWSDAMDSYSAALNVSYVVEKYGFKEVVRIEPTSYFFNGKRTLMDKVVSSKELNTKVDTGFSYKSIEIGYELGADKYEEAVGLDEFNGKINWITPLSRAEGSYQKLSRYRADSTGLIFAVRKPVKKYPTEDTTYDNDIFFLDMKRGTYNVYDQRVWQDDYATAPTGLYSPGTATNLRLCPSEMFKRHEAFISSCLMNYRSKKITFGSGVGNVLMGLDGELSNRDIPILDIDKPFFTNVSIEFDYDTDFELENALSDNIYGIFEFNDSKGTVWQFRLFEFKKNKYKGFIINGI